MKKHTLSVLTAALFAATALAAADPTPVFEGDMKATVQFDLRKPIEPINRRVLGLCIMFPPFSPKVIEASKPILKDSSVRVWLHNWTKKDYMQDVMGLVKECDVAEVLSMSPMCRMNNITASYRSETDHNLQLTHQKPSYQQNMIRSLNNLKHDGFPKGYGLTGYEIWNEPQFPQNGAWPADDYARYSLDVSKRVREVVPTMDIGVCLRPEHEYPGWNRQMLLGIAAKNPNAINFAIHHPYDFFWISSQKEIGSYYARAGGCELHGEELAADMKLLQQIGHGRWRMALTEWNTHPPGYKPPTNVSRDLAVAISMAGTIQMYWELGIDSAHYFLLHGKVKDGVIPHFALIAEKEDGELIFNPTYHVMKLYGEKCHGTRMTTQCTTPVYQYPNKGKTYKVPVVRSTAIFDFEKEELNILLVNRHESKALGTTIQMDNFQPTENSAHLQIVTGESANAETAIIKNVTVPLTMKANAPLVVNLEPHSVTAVTIKGIRPKTERERVSELLHPVKDWYICGVFANTEKQDHGLNGPLPCVADKIDTSVKYKGFENTDAYWTNIQADASGFINFFAPHKIIGLDQKARENLQGLAVSYIWSPDDREIGISFGADYWGTVAVNGKEVIDMRKTVPGPPAADKIRGKGKLSKGWNTVSVRAAGGSKGMGFWLSVENAGDLRFAAGTTTPATPPSKVKLIPKACTYINSWNELADKSLNDKKIIEVSGNKSTFRMTFIKWELPPGLKTAKIENAQIILTQDYEKTPGNITLGAVSASWQPTSTSFKKIPKYDKNVLGTGVLKDGKRIFSGKGIDDLIRRWQSDPSSNHGVWIGATSFEGYAGFLNDKQHPPVLQVELTP